LGDTPERSVSARPACARMFFSEASASMQKTKRPCTSIFGTRVSLVGDDGNLILICDKKQILIPLFVLSFYLSLQVA
jgi:hypothetical protein